MNNPSEKAKELVNKYINLVPEDFGGMDRDLAKQSALIVVDNLMTYAVRHGFKSMEDFYIKVQQEIEKL